ncbi:hypothetical protein D0962_04250 [Leptolyngbyaceae cyanobacterium CCMR0082]|uniref:Uncharacterized protein n=1 Tax=Adonisia turfae CCMR0082 TaxID=2304604 RepID=A0A6M0S235_9CYAN|nr:hypothetical protein [Adonisia turfae]NEZ61992.1 hypothetical protein [Adonisia turfae CCMR0082]
MTKEKTYIFYGCSGDESKDWSTLTGSDGSQSQHRLLSQHFDCSPNAEAPEEGYRLSEYKNDPSAYSRPLNKREAAGSTHHRPGPWVVTRVESYLPDLPVGTEYTEVVMCWCDYQPLLEADNPWIEMIMPNLADAPDEMLELMGLKPEQYAAVRDGSLFERESVGV